MHFFSSQKIYNKAISFFVSLFFLIESTMLPIITLLPKNVSADTSSIAISRTPATSPTSPYKAGDATAFTSTNPLWLFAGDYTGTGYNQIGSNPPRTFTFSTRNLINSGACNASTGQCTLPGNWDASSFVCPAGVTGVQQMKEWYAVAGLTSNTLTWYFQCSTGTIVENATLDGQPWDSPPFSETFDAPYGINQTVTLDLPQTFANMPTGTYTVTSVVAPAGVILQTINGHSLPYSQTLTTGGTITGTYNFITIPTSTITISRTPATSPTSPYKAGDATAFTSTNPLWLFAGDYTGTGYNQIGSNPPRTFTFSTRNLINSGACNASTGQCTLPGNWDASSFVCPAGVTGVQQMKEWYAVAGLTSNTLTWYFQCSTGTIVENATLDGQPWDSPPFSETFDAPYGINQTVTLDLPATFTGMQIGTYTLKSVTPPAGVTLRDVNGSSLPYSATLTAGGTITITYNFVTTSAPPSASTTPLAGSQLNPPRWNNWRVDACWDNNNGTADCGRHQDVADWWCAQAGGNPQLKAQSVTTDWENEGTKYVPTGRECPTCQLNLTSIACGIPPFPPTPTTAPMATLTFQHDQEQVLPNQLLSFSGTLDASQVAFPQGSSLFIAIPDGSTAHHIEIDGRTLASSEFSVSGSSIQIPFSGALYIGSHSFRLVLQNTLPIQLDRRVAIWVSVIDASGKLLLKGRTASMLIAHLPIEVIGKGTAVSLSRQVTYTSKWDYGPAFRALDGFSGDFDVTRGPFFTPNSILASIPISASLDTIPSGLSENIAFTMFPKDASMQRIGMTINQFSDPLAREFITAQYQYLLGRDPTSAEMSQYLPAFTQWRNPYAALREVYNRRADVQKAILVDKLKIVSGGSPYYSAGPVPSYDKLLEWAVTQGWKEEPSLASFKPQTGFDNDGWKLFDNFWNQWAGVQGYHTDNPSGDPNFSYADPGANVWEGDGAFEPDSFNFLNATCGGSFGPRQIGPSSESDSARNAIDKPDFATCWKNPYKRNQMILWAKDVGWAYNAVVQNNSGWYGGGDNNNGSYLTIRNLVEINPSGPVLASVFGPGKYPEFTAEQQLRYPPAALYYNLISSSEYASFLEPRFRKNIDSIYRLFLGRPAGAGDIDWAKNQFLNGGGEWAYPFNPTTASWINPQWEPNGQLIASDFQYVDAVEFLTNPRYITDDVYGIRHIPGEIDAVSSRLVELLEKNGGQLYQGDNFKRIVSGLYRLYLRRTPADVEVDSWRGKSIGDVEFGINQSAEYGKNPAKLEAINNLYRNYLGRDPDVSDLSWAVGKTISNIANGIGTSAEIKSVAQQHPENAYIFPIKRIKIVHCGFFCSVFGRIIGIALTVVSFASGNPYLAFISGGFAGAGAVSCGACLNSSIQVQSIVLNSISKGFSEAGFDGDTFVSNVSIARAMAGQAGGVFSMTNIFENADPTILEGFRTTAQAPQSNEFAQTESQPSGYGFASLLSSASKYLDTGHASSVLQLHLAQVDVSGHYQALSVGKSATTTTIKKSRAIPAPASKVSAAITRKLVRGASGNDVLALQKILGELDLTFLPQYQTGYFGSKTEAAVKRFQKRYGLEQVGYVGPKTRALLNLSDK